MIYPKTYSIYLRWTIILVAAPANSGKPFTEMFFFLWSLKIWKFDLAGLARFVRFGELGISGTDGKKIAGALSNAPMGVMGVVFATSGSLGLGPGFM